MTVFNHRVLFCDLGNVILPFDFGPAIHKLASLSGRSLEQIQEFLFQPGFQEKYETGKMNSSQFLDLVRSSLEFETPDEQLVLIWNDVFSENRPMIEWLESVLGKFPIWGISNTNELHFGYIQERYPIVRKLDGWILSYQVGYRKPSHEIFKIALDRVGILAEQAFFVDDLPANVEAAKRVGIQSHLFEGLSPLIVSLKEQGYCVT